MTRLEFLTALLAAPLGALSPRRPTGEIRFVAKSQAEFNCLLEITFERIAAERAPSWMVAQRWCEKYGGRVADTYLGTVDPVRRICRIGIHHPGFSLRFPSWHVEGSSPYIAALLTSDRAHEEPSWLARPVQTLMP